MLAKEGQTDYLPTLDGWRAVAILGVLICHGADALFNTAGLYPDARWYGLTRHGALGVDIFFGISGFLICTRLLQEQQRNGRISLTNFYLRRAFRILPPYLTYLLVLVILAACGLLAINRWEWLSCLVFFRNYLTPQTLGGWYTAHFWSLAVEEHFYLLWPGLLVLGSPRRLRRWVVVIVLTLAAWRALDFRYQWIARLLPSVGFSLRTDIRLDALLMGCWVAMILPLRREWLARVLSPIVWGLLVVGLIGCVMVNPPLMPLWRSTLIPFILVGTVLHPDGLVGRLYETAPLRWIGRMSYSLYLWQQLFLVGQETPRLSSLGVLQQWPLNILMVFICAAISYYLLERPMINLGHRLTRQRRVQPARGSDPGWGDTLPERG